MDEDSLTHLASVVICARNRERLIGDTLASVRRNVPGEVVVVDDGSTDRTAAVAGRLADRVVASGGNGLAAARQLGAELAGREIVVYVDSDVVMEDDCLARLVQALKADPALGAVTARREQLGPGSYWSRCGREVRAYLRPKVGPYRHSFPCTTVAIPRSLILEIGFDPYFVGAGEDIDFSTRLDAAGWRILELEEAVVWHRPRDGTVAFVRQQIWYGRGQARALAKRRSLAPAVTPRANTGGWGRRLLRDRRLSLVPYVLVSGAAYQLGIALERRRLRFAQDGDGARAGSR